MINFKLQAVVHAGISSKKSTLKWPLSGLRPAHSILITVNKSTLNQEFVLNSKVATSFMSYTIVQVVLHNPPSFSRQHGWSQCSTCWFQRSFLAKICWNEESLWFSLWWIFSACIYLWIMMLSDSIFSRGMDRFFSFCMPNGTIVSEGFLEFDFSLQRELDANKTPTSFTIFQNFFSRKK